MKILKLISYIFLISSLFISIIVLKSYEFNKIKFILFSLVCNFYIFFSLFKKANLFHLFNSFFLWMGFWLKFILAYFSLSFEFGDLEATNLEYIDEALIVSSIGILGFLVSSILNIKYFPLKITDKQDSQLINLADFTIKYNFQILIFFIVIIFFISVINYNFSLYQKGVISNKETNFFVLSVFKWLLLFGLSSISAFLIYHFLINKKLSASVLIVSLLENFLISISILSRGMFINFMALYLGILKYSQFIKIKKLKSHLFSIFILFSILFILSLIIVKDLRQSKYFPIKNEVNKVEFKIKSKLRNNAIEVINLIKNRFVGLDGVLAVASYDKKSFDTIYNSFKNKDQDSERYSFFQQIIQKSKIETSQSQENLNTNFIKVPGIIAFTYYSGSLIFVFIITFILGLIIGYFEKIVFKFSKENIVFASLISQVLAYRLSNFGYMPYNTHLIVVTIILNLLIIYFLYKLFNNIKNY